MASVTLSITDQFKEQLKHFQWVNWSEIAKEETRKKLIFEKYLKTGEVSDDDWKFCDKIDWHPVDELPLKEEFVEKLKKTKKKKSIRISSVADIFK
ncbi:MAG TPA: hypothetical protein VI894_03465 [Candidatus Nanoarchaeia archaeon]|nr:hypothetical protein [Candidatus Nanoarchaeia archaeon]